MAAGTLRYQNHFSMIDTINQQPIRLYMTFAKAFPITTKCMIMILLLQDLFITKSNDGPLQIINGQMPFLSQLVVSLKLIGVSGLKHSNLPTFHLRSQTCG